MLDKNAKCPSPALVDTERALGFDAESSRAAPEGPGQPGDYAWVRNSDLPAAGSGTTLAFIGAIVGEFFGGTSNVLGRVVLQAISGGKFDVAWAAILIGAVAAILAYAAVTLIERAVIPWYWHIHDEPE